GGHRSLAPGCQNQKSRHVNNRHVGWSPMMGRRKWWVTAATAAVLGASLVAPPAIGAPPTSDEPITDPIPEDPEPAELGLVLSEYAQLPETDTTPPTDDKRLMRHNRINYIGEIG